VKVKIILGCVVATVVSNVFAVIEGEMEALNGRKFDDTSVWTAVISSGVAGVWDNSADYSNVLGLINPGILEFNKLYFGARNTRAVHATLDFGGKGNGLKAYQLQLDGKAGVAAAAFGSASYIKLTSGTLGLTATGYRFLFGDQCPGNTLEANGADSLIDMGTKAVWFGKNFSHNRILVRNGATFKGSFYIGCSSVAASNNIVSIEGAGSSLVVPSDTTEAPFIGAAGGCNSVIITNQATFKIEKATPLYIGYDWTGNSPVALASKRNRLLVCDKSTAQLASTLYVGAHSGENVVEVGGGSTLTVAGGAYVGTGVSSAAKTVRTSGNRFIVKGKGTSATVSGGRLFLGHVMSDANKVEVADGATLTISGGSLLVGNGDNAANNGVAIASGAKLEIVNSVWDSYIGNNGAGAFLVIDGGTVAFDKYIRSGGSVSSTGDRIAVLNGGMITNTVGDAQMIVGGVGNDCSLVVSNGTIHAYQLRLGIDGGQNSRFVVGGTNNTVKLTESFVAKNSATLEFGIPAEKWTEPVVLANNVDLEANTTIKVTVDPKLQRGGRVVLMKSNNAVNLSNVIWDLPPRARFDTTNNKEVAVRVPGNQGLIIVIK